MGHVHYSRNPDFWCPGSKPIRAEVDWTHPYARGLLFVSLCGTSLPVDLVSNQPSFSASATLAPVTTLADGAAISFTSASSMFYANVLRGSTNTNLAANTGIPSTPALNCTVISRFRSPLSGGSPAVFLNSDNSVGLGVGSQSGTTVCASVRTSSGGFTNLTSAAATANKFLTVGVTGNNNSANPGGTLYLNGVFQNTSAGGSNTGNGNAATVSFACRMVGATSNFFQGDVSYGAVWNYPMTQDDHLAIADNPFCFLKPVG